MKTLVLESGPDGEPQYLEAFESPESRASLKAALKTAEEGLRDLRKTSEKAGLTLGEWKKGE